MIICYAQLCLIPLEDKNQTEVPKVFHVLMSVRNYYCNLIPFT